MVTNTTKHVQPTLFRIVDLPWVSPGLGNLLKGTKHQDVLDYIIGFYVGYGK